MIDRTSTRRQFATGAAAAFTGALILPHTPLLARQATPAAPLLDELVIDLAGTPESIDPALAYSSRDWSVVHAIYDSIVQFGPDGSIEPLAAESFTTVDNITFEVRLRSGLVFHDGSPVTAAAVARSIAYLVDSGSDASGLFTGIAGVVEDEDGLTARITCAEPSPWLPAQFAPWLVLVPEGYTHDLALTSPVGSGPYRVESIDAGNAIVLARNPDYTWDSPKGTPIADRVTYRFVPEVTTRVADLATGSAGIISEVPNDQFGEIESAGATPVEVPTVASAFIRIATDVEPFDRVEVRQALNHAIDVQAIATALVSPVATRLASIFPDERSMGFDPDVQPYAYDPDRARELLASAGVNGLEVDMEVTTGARTDIAEAIAAQLGEVGFDVTIKVLEYTEFNATWKEPSAAPLRMVTWGPLYDPHTLLSLVFDSEGFLSRFASDQVDSLIRAAAAETDGDTRVTLYRDLNAAMSADPPAVFLWNLTSGYGVAADATAWQPRGDDYVLPVVPA